MTRNTEYSPEAKFVSTIKFNTFLILEFERPFEAAGWTFLPPESSSYQVNLLE
jgi:hypothetical protein